MDPVAALLHQYRTDRATWHCQFPLFLALPEPLRANAVRSHEMPAREGTNHVSVDRLHMDTWPAAVYAVGDVHGCRRQLLALESAVIEDAAAILGEKWIVMLGDYIDRGPESAGVVDHLLQPPPHGFVRHTLRGNHEQMMLDFLDDPRSNLHWLDQGGAATLASYGVDVDRTLARLNDPEALLGQIAERVPPSHIEFLRGLPVLLGLPGWLFVHAGLRPGIGLEQQSMEDLLWIRDPFLYGPGLPGIRVVHGHTPVPAPEFTPARIGIDTGCFLTGRLTGLRITPDGLTKVLTVP